jgi:hypothetical protein
MAQIKTSISFVIGGDGAGDGVVVGEIDTRPASEGGLNASRLGKTSDFSPGDKVSVLVWMSAGVVYDPQKYPNKCYAIHNWHEIQSLKLTNTKVLANYEITEEVKFSGEERTASLSKPAVKGTLKICRWLGTNLATYYGSSNQAIILSDDGTSIELPKVPESWKPSFSAGESALARENKTDEFTRRTRQNGIVVVKYSTSPVVFEIALPSKAELERFGKSPWPLELVFYCYQEQTVSSCV